MRTGNDILRVNMGQKESWDSDLSVAQLRIPDEGPRP